MTPPRQRSWQHPGAEQVAAGRSLAVQASAELLLDLVADLELDQAEGGWIERLLAGGERDIVLAASVLGRLREAAARGGR